MQVSGSLTKLVEEVVDGTQIVSDEAANNSVRQEHGVVNKTKDATQYPVKE